MKTLDLIVIEDAIQWLNNHQTIWLCTVLRTYGSAPRSPGALLVATDQGEFIGSLSGGCIEEDFLQKIQAQYFQQPSQVVRYGDGNDEYRPNVQLPCGGSIDVLIEHLLPNQDNLNYLSQMLSAIQGQCILEKQIKIGQAAQLLKSTEPLPQRIEYDESFIRISLQSCTTIFIACLSAVAMYCIDFAHALGFAVIVCEDREEELRQIQSKPDLFKKVTLIETFPSSYLDEYGCSPQTAILSLTHDPRIDDLTMMSALETPAFYIGAMGSKQNSQNRIARLKECTNFPDHTLNRIHAPIGLPIGSKTPAEIALAIMADIVKAKNH